MEKYNYFENIKLDCLDYIEENGIDLRETDREDLYDILWYEVDVTGNTPEGYHSKERCAEFLYDNLDLLLEAFEEFGVTYNNIPKDMDINVYCDTTIRCYLLGAALDKIYEEACVS